MSRLGTPYQKNAVKTDSYTVDKSDDFITFEIATAKTCTLPAAGTCKGDDAEKYVANLGASGDSLTIAVPAGDTITGATTLTAGQALFLHSDGLKTWAADSPISAEGMTNTSISTADSKGVSAGTRASVADSKAVSDSVLASTADSKGVSSGTRASVADSKALSVSTLTSTADSKGVSSGTGASTADSKGVSAGTGASTADSKAVSNSVVVSALTSRVSSAGG